VAVRADWPVPARVAILSDFPLAAPLLPGFNRLRLRSSMPRLVLPQPRLAIDNLKAAWLSWPISFRFDRRQQIGLNALSDAPAFAPALTKYASATGRGASRAMVVIGAGDQHAKSANG
jgi:hypothetical protein